MKDNLLFFGVPEGNLKIPSETPETQISYNTDPTECPKGDMLTENTHDDDGIQEDEDRTGTSALPSLPVSSQAQAPVTGVSYSAAAMR
jgi:hypothetical protein